jgi:hypothetical protein
MYNITGDYEMAHDGTGASKMGLKNVGKNNNNTFRITRY